MNMRRWEEGAVKYSLRDFRRDECFAGVFLVRTLFVQCRAGCRTFIDLHGGD